MRGVAGIAGALAAMVPGASGAAGDFALVNQVLARLTLPVDVSWLEDVPVPDAVPGNVEAISFGNTLNCSGFAVGDLGMTGSMAGDRTKHTLGVAVEGVSAQCELEVQLKPDGQVGMVGVSVQDFALRPSFVASSSDFAVAGPSAVVANPEQECGDIVDLSGLGLSGKRIFLVPVFGLTVDITGTVLELLRPALRDAFASTICDALDEATAPLAAALVENALMAAPAAPADSVRDRAESVEALRPRLSNIEPVDWHAAGDVIANYTQTAAEYKAQAEALIAYFQSLTLEELFDTISLSGEITLPGGVVIDLSPLADYSLTELGDLSVAAMLELLGANLPVWVDLGSITVREFFELAAAGSLPDIEDLVDWEALQLALGVNVTEIIGEDRLEAIIRLIELLFQVVEPAPPPSLPGNGTDVPEEPEEPETPGPWIDLGELDWVQVLAALEELAGMPLPVTIVDGKPVVNPEQLLALLNAQFGSDLPLIVEDGELQLDLPALLDMLNITVPGGGGGAQLPIDLAKSSFSASFPRMNFAGTLNKAKLNEWVVLGETLLMPELDLGDLSASFAWRFNSTISFRATDELEAADVQLSEDLDMSATWRGFGAQAALVAGYERSTMEVILAADDMNTTDALLCALNATFLNVTAGGMSADAIVMQFPDVNGGLLRAAVSVAEALWPMYKGMAPAAIEGLMAAGMESVRMDPPGTCAPLDWQATDSPTMSPSAAPTTSKPTTELESDAGNNGDGSVEGLSGGATAGIAAAAILGAAGLGLAAFRARRRGLPEGAVVESTVDSPVKADQVDVEDVSVDSDSESV